VVAPLIAGVSRKDVEHPHTYCVFILDCTSQRQISCGPADNADSPWVRQTQSHHKQPSCPASCGVALSSHWTFASMLRSPFPFGIRLGCALTTSVLVVLTPRQQGYEKRNGAQCACLLPIMVLLSLAHRFLPAATVSVSWMVQEGVTTVRHARVPSSPAPRPASARATAPGLLPGARWR